MGVIHSGPPVRIQGPVHDMGGFVGAVTYEGDLQEFMPLVILGQYTHVGKYAVWGNGRYEVVK